MNIFLILIYNISDVFDISINKLINIFSFYNNKEKEMI